MLKVTLKDYTNFEEGLHWNGGQYGYEEVAFVKHGKIIAGHHWTTAHLGWCDLCGTFEQNVESHKDRWHDDGLYQPSDAMLTVVEAIERNGGDIVQLHSAAYEAVPDSCQEIIIQIGKLPKDEPKAAQRNLAHAARY